MSTKREALGPAGNVRGVAAQACTAPSPLKLETAADDHGVPALHTRAKQSTTMRRRDDLLRTRVDGLAALFRPSPLVTLDHPCGRVHVKLDQHVPTGSTKGRAAWWILKRAIERGEVTAGTTIVESSSGNFATSMASFCRMLGLRFVAVIDPNTSQATEAFLRDSCADVVKVSDRDDTGGFLLSRLRRVEALVDANPSWFWSRQYTNLDAAEAHYLLTGREMLEQLPSPDYVFIGVSTASTLAGVSRRFRESSPRTRIIAVDADGSVAFGGPAARRRIPGLGSSVVPDLLRLASFDAVVHVTEEETVRGAQRLLWLHGLWVGGSSGSVFAAIEKALPMGGPGESPSILFLAVDSGLGYLSKIYDPPTCLEPVFGGVL